MCRLAVDGWRLAGKRYPASIAIAIPYGSEPNTTPFPVGGWGLVDCPLPANCVPTDNRQPTIAN